MRRLFVGLFLFVAVVSVPVAVSPQPGQSIPSEDYHSDSRLQCLLEFFGKGDCPAQQYSGAFLEAADDYDLDWRLLPSISYVESGGGKNAPNNNLFGWACGRAQFASPEAGIHAVAYRLAHSGLYKGKSLDQLLATYNPIEDYGRKVKSVMRQIAPSE